MKHFETKKSEFLRKGAMEKVKWLEKIDQAILPSQAEKIRKNDKTVLKELVLPSWVTWDIIYDWASTKTRSTDKTCVFCGLQGINGLIFQEKYICEDCFLRLKNH